MGWQTVGHDRATEQQQTFNPSQTAKEGLCAGSLWSSLVAQMVKNPPAVGDLGSTPGLGRSPGGEHGNPL